MKIAPETLRDMLARNPQLSIDDNQAKGKVQGAVTKRDAPPTLVRTKKREAESVPGVTVRFIGHRVRPLDPDNFAGGCKDLLDGLRRFGILSDDAWDQIRLETSQVKVRTYREEWTDIEVIT